ncbi:hypothetical protein LOK74_08170 [Brevibacillus humidisoli]|uniref:3-oxoacyl-[acyl-carrier-protein] synthase III C-terminal domain-containing protein n=1 Tax=Brevibacillus humidisoli TaxID=2895522 RepID=UPI001E54B7FB|nr:3-oxoacyl-[acyl-carrier-protein] synthase III C-terminal domain-containing protein [Brevibacillus humidisoli]UFJ42450.1 hypothetical protein LOK74_08170 [Brevibacillus humidisoli]
MRTTAHQSESGFQGVCGIADFSIYIPEERVTLDRVAEMIRESGYSFSEEDLNRFRDAYRFHSVPIERERCLEEMIVEACAPLLSRLQQKQKRVDKLVFLRTSQLYWHDRNLFRKLIHDYGLQQTHVLSVSQHNCASFHLALRVCQNLFSSQPDLQGILLVAADKAFHPSLRRIPDSLLGDCASACYLERGCSEHQLLHVLNLVDPKADPDDVDWFNTTYYFAIRQMLLRLLKETDLQLEDIRLLIGGNVNQRTWERMAEMLNLPIERFYTQTIPEVGHLYGSDLLYNLMSAGRDGLIRRSDFYVTISIGLGGMYGCALHRC